jgi:hypothetical protein
VTILPAALYHLDLRPDRVLDFKAEAKAEAGREITIQISARGGGRHTFAVRTENLQLEQPEQGLELDGGHSKVATFRATIADPETPWVAVVIPDGAVSQGRELTGSLKPRN